MTSKERVLAAFAHCEPDRVPINYMANAGIDARLKKHFGLGPHDDTGLRDALGVDFRGIGAPYVGARLHAEQPGIQVDPLWGIHRRWVEHETGGYWDYCDFPLRNADEEQIANWPMPSPDDYDYSSLAEDCRRLDHYAIGVGGAGTGCIINTAGFHRTMEQVLVDLFTDDAAGLLLVDRILAVEFEVLQRTLDKVGKLVDFVWMGEDLGTQRGPLISMELLQRHILPRHKRFIDLATSYDLPVMMHTCGSSSWAYEEYIRLGLKGVETMQPEAAMMDPKYLKETFGGRLFFHGCISTAGPVAYGTVADVTKIVQETLDVMMPGGGYCLSPTHALQDNSPLENVLAMYDAAHRFGRY